MRRKILELAVLLISIGLFSYVIFWVQPPASIYLASVQQLIYFFGSLGLIIFWLTRLLKADLITAVALTWGALSLTAFRAIGGLDIFSISAVIVIIILVTILRSRLRLTKRAQIPKLSKLTGVKYAAKDRKGNLI